MQSTHRRRINKKALLIVRSAFNIVRLLLAKIWTYLSCIPARWSWHLTLPGAKQVVKVSSGHIPLPF